MNPGRVFSSSTWTEHLRLGRASVRGPGGTEVTLRFSENLAEDGTVNQENLRKAAATDRYILKGEGEEEWEPRFTYHGFRYLQLEGYPGRPTLESIRAKVVRSSVEANGQVETSNELINAIQKMVWWTEAGNLHSIPTDCPQRDERMGWLNDLTVRAEEAIYNFNLSRFFTKFLNDIGDAQEDDGSITDTVPFTWGRARRIRSRPATCCSPGYFTSITGILEPWRSTSPVLRPGPISWRPKQRTAL